MTPDQIRYLEWMRALSTESATEVLAGLTPGMTYAPVEMSDGTFAFKCPKCEKTFSDEDTDEILGAIRVTCACGHVMRFASDAWVIPYDKHGVLSDPANISRTTWFHVSKSSTWDETQNSVIHVGTRQSAIDRARDMVMGNEHDGDLYLYEVTVNPLATVSPVVFPDMVELWDDVTEYCTGHVTRYVNAYEDPGSISLIVNSRIATMHQVATVNVDILGTPHVTPLSEMAAA